MLKLQENDKVLYGFEVQVCSKFLNIKDFYILVEKIMTDFPENYELLF